MTELYLVRHAEAEGNLYRRAQGWYDSLITPRGYRQLAALRERFAEVPLEAVYSSDLFRTQTTARALYEPKHLPLRVLPWLREIGIGVWEDVPWALLAFRYAEQLRCFNMDLSRWTLEGAETGEAVQKRMLAAVKLLAMSHPDAAIAAVSHGSAIRLLLAAVEGLPLSEIGKAPHSDNTAVSLLEIEGDAIRVAYRDDASHLEKDESLSTLRRQSWWKKADGIELGIWYAPAELGAAYLSLLERSAVPVTAEEANAFFAQDSEALWQVMQGDTPVGALVLDTRRGILRQEGWVAGLGLLPALRGHGYGEQLLGQAIAVYRPQGRQSLCFAHSEDLRGFWEQCGCVCDGGIARLDIGYHLRAF